MTAIQRKRVRRLSVWTLIFSILLLTCIPCLPVHGAVLDDVKQGAQKTADAVGNAANDAKNGVEKAVGDASDGMQKSDGTVQDGDGMIGNEANEEAPGRGMEKLGKVALLVLIAAVIIAIIMIVSLVPKRKNK